MYNIHPDKALSEAFASKPYQGAAPETAKFIFVGLDANYHPEVHRNLIYTRLLEYLDGGISFWKRYVTDGSITILFQKLVFRLKNADEVCFIELANRPSFGRSSLVPTDLGTITFQFTARLKRESRNN